MKHHAKRQLKLADVIACVACYTRSDHEVGLVVADLINRGVVRVRPQLSRRGKRR